MLASSAVGVETPETLEIYPVKPLQDFLPVSLVIEPDQIGWSVNAKLAQRCLASVACL